MYYYTSGSKHAHLTSTVNLNPTNAYINVEKAVFCGFLAGKDVHTLINEQCIAKNVQKKSSLNSNIAHTQV